MCVAVAGRASAVEIVRPAKTAAISLANSSAPALAGEAQSVHRLEKASDWLSGSPDTQSGREVLLR